MCFKSHSQVQLAGSQVKMAIDVQSFGQQFGMRVCVCVCVCGVCVYVCVGGVLNVRETPL